MIQEPKKKRSQGRPCVGDPRNHMMQVNLTDAEYEAVVNEARNSDRTRSEVIRRLIRSGLGL